MAISLITARASRLTRNEQAPKLLAARAGSVHHRFCRGARPHASAARVREDGADGEALRARRRKRSWQEPRSTPDTHRTCRTLARLRIRRRFVVVGASAKATESSRPFPMLHSLVLLSMVGPVLKI